MRWHCTHCGTTYSESADPVGRDAAVRAALAEEDGCEPSGDEDVALEEQ
jgi:hypothetical protein